MRIQKYFGHTMSFLPCPSSHIVAKEKFSIKPRFHTYPTKVPERKVAPLLIAYLVKTPKV